MRRFGVSCFLMLALLPSWAATRVTVSQLEQTLTAASTAHKNDLEMARQIGRLDTSERISEATLTRLKKQFASGSKAALALELLADRSSFLDLPVSELPNLPAPDQAARQEQLEAVQKFAVELLPRLPNLLATRTTYYFDNGAQELQRGDLLILGDSAHEKMVWSHWEQGESGPVSVFSFSVPKSSSHYEIATPLEAVSSPWSWYRDAAQMVPPETLTSKVLRTKPAYHGSLWIDPSKPAILRISLIAELKGNPTLEHAAILIEYGAVRVKDEMFICPIRSLALSARYASVGAMLDGAATEWMNENLFTDYHLFASTSRILTGKSE